MRYPTHIEYKGNEFKIDTDFRVALECLEFVSDESISDTERSLNVITLLFGADIPTNEEVLLLAKKYLECGVEKDGNKSIHVKDMDFEQDQGLIEASFMSDYQIDLSEIKYMHWWKFCNLISGLRPDCALNRVREIRNYDISEIKNEKARRDAIKAKEQVALKTKLSADDQQDLDEFEKLFE